LRWHVDGASAHCFVLAETEEMKIWSWLLSGNVAVECRFSQTEREQGQDLVEVVVVVVSDQKDSLETLVEAVLVVAVEMLMSGL